ncbi:hypothetical protein PFISCL1PPCAC_27436, partial [Pristionchus fissidentatus]
AHFPLPLTILMKSPLLPGLILLLSCATAFQVVDKVDELPLDVVDIHSENARPKVRRCGDSDASSETSEDCVLCTVCLPHEYELMGCSEKIDSVCATCGSGLMRNTPKTPDFFVKCKPLIHSSPIFYPDYLYPLPVKTDEGSMFADQEKTLMGAELKEFNLERIEEESEEDDEDYEEEEEAEIKPVSVDERDEDSDSMEQEEDPETMAEEQDEMEKEIERTIKLRLFDDAYGMDENIKVVEADEEVMKMNEEFMDGLSEEVEIKMDTKEEESVDPFEEEKSKNQLSDIPYENRIHPLQHSSIWGIMEARMGKFDDIDGAIDTDAEKEIISRKEDWLEMKRLEKLSILRKKINSPPVEIVDVFEYPKTHGLTGGFRPLPIGKYGSTVSRVPILHDTRLVLASLFLSCIGIFIMVVCYHTVRVVQDLTRREMTLPEIDEMNRQLINEAHARIHGRKEKGVRPEFV